MTMTELYELIDKQFKTDGIAITFSQPQPSATLPLVQVGPHTDLDQSTKTGPALNQVEQQIDVWTEMDSVASFEDVVRKVKWSLNRAFRWENLTTQTMLDTSSGRDLRRALLLVTYTI